MMPEIKILEALLDRSNLINNKTLWTSPWSTWHKMHPRTLGPGQFLKTFNPVFQSWQGDFAPHIDKISEHLFSHYELHRKSTKAASAKKPTRASSKATGTAGASTANLSRFQTLDDRALNDTHFLFIISRSQFDFDMTPITAKRTFPAMGVWAFVMYTAYLRVHGGIFTTSTGILLRDELHRLLGQFAASSLLSLIPEGYRDDHPPIYGWVNWDHLPLILDGDLPRYAWLGQSLYEDVDAHEDLLGTTLRRNEWRKSLHTLVDSVFAMPAAQYDPLNTEDETGTSKRLSAWVQEPLERLVQVRIPCATIYDHAANSPAGNCSEHGPPRNSGDGP